MVVLLLTLHATVSVDISLGVHVGPVKDPVVLEDGYLVVPSKGVPASFPGGEAILVQAQERGCRQAAAAVDGPVEFAIDIPDVGPEVLEGSQAGGKQRTERFVFQPDRRDSGRCDERLVASERRLNISPGEKIVKGSLGMDPIGRRVACRDVQVGGGEVTISAFESALGERSVFDNTGRDRRRQSQNMGITIDRHAVQGE